MTHLILTIDDLKDHAAIDFINGFEVIQPFVKDAENWLKRRYLGDALFTKLASLRSDVSASVSESESVSGSVSGSESGSNIAIYNELLSLSQGIVTNIALLNYIPEGQLEISSQGIRINTTDTKKTAFQWQIELLENRYKIGSNTKLEALLQVLFTNDVEEWATSSVLKQLRKRFINSALQFEQFFSIEESHLLFIRLLPDMDYVEKIYLRNLLGDEFMSELRERILDKEDLPGKTPSPVERNYILLFELIFTTVAYLTIQHTKIALPDGKPDDIEIRAAHAQQQLKEFLNAKASSTLFTVYFSSEKYTAPDTNSNQHAEGVDNSQFNGLYAAL